MADQNIEMVDYGWRHESRFEPQQVDVQKYSHQFGRIFTWEAESWYDVCRSWYETSYIHAGISGFENTISGPDAQRLLSEVSINDVYTWGIGRCKHLVMCDDNGLIQNHALFMRTGEDSFATTAGNDWPFMFRGAKLGYDFKSDVREVFVFQFSGPKSLTIIERLTRTDLHDVRFLDFRPVVIPGIDGELRLVRIGMSGTLAYEIQGPQALGPSVYAAALAAGQPLGLKRLGWRSYPVNHTYGGYPQMTCTFETACYVDPDFRAPWPIVCTGSVDPADQRARFRSVGEAGWGWMAKFNHDFRGRAAVEAEVATPRRTVVSLMWNVDDLLDIYKSLWEEGEPYKYMEFPAAQQEPAGGHQDYIMNADGEVVGYSAVPIYSSWWHTTISESVVDVAYAEEGTELVVQWGDFGHRIKNVRAIVVRYPYSNVTENKDYDVSAVEHGEGL